MTRVGRRRAPVAATLEFIRALEGLARTTWLFRRGGAEAVAWATAEASREPAEYGTRREDVDLEMLSRSLRAVQRARAVWPLHVDCLQTSMVLHGLYRRRGLPARLVVGVRMDGGELASHAWVDVRGIAVDDTRGTRAFTHHLGETGDA